MEEGNNFLNNLFSAVGEFLRLRTDDLRKDIIKAMSVGFSGILSILVITLLLIIVLAVFAYALILLIGELIGSISGAAFIVGGIYLILASVLIALRKRLFLSMFTNMFTEIAGTETKHDDLKEFLLTIIRSFR